MYQYNPFKLNGSINSKLVSCIKLERVERIELSSKGWKPLIIAIIRYPLIDSSILIYLYSLV